MRIAHIYIVVCDLALPGSEITLPSPIQIPEVTDLRLEEKRHLHAHRHRHVVFAVALDDTLHLLLDLLDLRQDDADAFVIIDGKPFCSLSWKRMSGKRFS